MSRTPSPSSAPTLFVLAFLSCFVLATTALAQVSVTEISTDTFSNTTSQHATEVEADSYAVGSTIVSVFQIGRFTDGGSSDIGFSTSTNGGTTWTHGNLPGITKFQAGTYDRASDPAITYNNKHKLWLASTLALSEAGGSHGAAVLVSSSVDGITWKNPVTVATAGATGFFDKDWIACDNTATSPFYGNCYVEWDDFSQFDLIEMSTSKNGGTTWSASSTTGGSAAGNGGLPLVQPNGTVIVPIDDAFQSSVLAFRSTDGGNTWSTPVTVAGINLHGVEGGMRAPALISAQMDAAGKVYVAWADCRFRRSCGSNDIVMSTSTDGISWAAVSRIPLDAITGNVDHFLPCLEVDRATSGATAHLSVTYYYFPTTQCTTTCQLRVAYSASTNGGATWSRTRLLATGMNSAWLPSTTSGQMVGDYTSATTSGGKIHAIFATANAPVGSTFDEAMQTNAAGLPDLAEDGVTFTSKHDKPVANAHSDHPRLTTPVVGQ